MIDANLTTPRLALMCLDESHVTERYRSWMTNPEITRYLEARFADLSLASLREYVATMRASRHSYLFGIFSSESGTHLGNIKLGPISAVHASAPVGLIIGDQSTWGTGIAQEAITAISSWAFNALCLEKLTAGSYGSNAGSVSAFLKCGFHLEGTQRSQVQLDNGERDDVLLLGKTRADSEPVRR